MKTLKNRPIGIFDSGVGGLTVAKSVSKYLPNEDIIYFGDTARVPYGNKSKNTIIRFAKEIMEFMLKKNVKMVVVACNTASSLSLSVLRKQYSIPVIGVITPGVKEAASKSKNKRIGVIGTTSTINSKAYNKELCKLDKDYSIFSKSCPLFVPLVENKVVNEKIIYDIANMYLKAMKKKKVDALILGCTHYPILKNVIKKVVKNVNLIDSSFAVAKEVKKVLSVKGLEAARKRHGDINCFVSDDAKGFKDTAGIFLKKDIKVTKVVI